MTFKRYKEVRKATSNPRFTVGNCTKFGVSPDELDIFNVGNPLKKEYDRRIEKNNTRKLILIGLSVIAAPFILLFGFAFTAHAIDTYFRANSLENLTGKKLDYWDIFNAGQHIRVNSELIDRK